MKKIFIYILMLFCTLGISAQTLSDSAQMSLLTCTPGDYVYSQYGHSAIRVQDPTQNIDITFNYGIFSFDTDNFYGKFIKGETDYQLGIEYTRQFLWSSAYIGRTTYEQPLNLTIAQKQAIFDALMLNYEPENRFYRYNFVFDNCATRPYHLLMSVLDTANMQSNYAPEACTYRSLISHYSQANLWQDFGVNLIFGKAADKVMTLAERLFLPEELMRFVSGLRFADDTPLTDAGAVAPFEVTASPWWMSPYVLVGLLCILLIIVSWLDLKHRRVSWWLDAVLFLVYGILGSIAFYLTFFSLHPLVGENYNLLFFNPLSLVLFVLCLFPRGRQWLGKVGLWISLYFYAALVLRLCVGQAWHWLLLLAIVHYLRIRLVWYRDEFILGQRTKDKGQRMRLFVFALLYILHSTFYIPEARAESPRLTIVVCVNGLHGDALNNLRDFLPVGGLRTLDEEAHEAVIRFPQLVFGGSETLATIATGTTPSTHGIAANNYFHRTDRCVRSLFIDSDVSGIGTADAYSPASLLSATFADEFRMLHPSEHSKIYALGINPENTVLLAGHAAQACAWINPETLQWASTSYYQKGLPTAADKMNMEGRFVTLAATPWEAKMDMNMYLHPSTTEERKGYKYDFVSERDRAHFLQSPMANKAVVELALALQQSENLGKDPYPDLLSLELNVTSPAATSDLLRSAEQEDMYIGLNQDLGYLMEQLSKRIGKDNIRIILFGKPCFGQGSEVFANAALPTNYFNVERAAALINTYLMALYGHERWVDGGYLHSIYLNRTLIEQKRLSLPEIQQQVSNFLLEFKGTQQAFAITDAPLLSTHQSLPTFNYQFSINKRCFGDVIFTLQPMWLLGDGVKNRQDKVVEENPQVPLFIWTTERMSIPSGVISATDIKQLILN